MHAEKKPGRRPRTSFRCADDSPHAFDEGPHVAAPAAAAAVVLVPAGADVAAGADAGSCRAARVTVFLQERAQEPWELLKQRFNAARDAHAAAAAAVDAEVVAAEAAAAEKAAAEKAAAEESRARGRESRTGLRRSPTTTLERRRGDTR